MDYKVLQEQVFNFNADNVEKLVWSMNHIQW